ncbi:hypothetical protein MLD52_03265 [Puniceicoccaceae bacterium K14]|nr:hypothetical protein [Puniceicoccaceae bacterium K14]
MKNLIAAFLFVIACSLSSTAIGSTEISSSISTAKSQEAVAHTAKQISEENIVNFETTPVLVASFDNNFYQLENKGSNNATKLALLGAAILIGFITHRRMSFYQG